MQVADDLTGGGPVVLADGQPVGAQPVAQQHGRALHRPGDGGGDLGPRVEQVDVVGAGDDERVAGRGRRHVQEGERLGVVGDHVGVARAGDHLAEHAAAHGTGPRTSAPLCPPKANEVLSTRPAGSGRGDRTTSRSPSAGSTAAVPCVGGTCPWRSASTAATALEGARRAEAVAGHALDARDRPRLAQRGTQRAGLRRVVQRGRRPVRADVHDVRRVRPGVLERQPHAVRGRRARPGRGR